MAYKILVVDDEKDVVEAISKKLLLEGFEPICAYDGEEALIKVKETSPDVVLLDLTMPKLNGFEVLKRIREEYAYKWIPVIIVSANADLNAVRKSYNMEADHYLIKPCSMDKVIHGINTMISLIPMRKE